MASGLMSGRRTVDLVCAACGDSIEDEADRVFGEDHEVYCTSCSDDLHTIARGDDDDYDDDDDDDVDDYDDDDVDDDYDDDEDDD